MLRPRLFCLVVLALASLITADSRGEVSLSIRGLNTTATGGSFLIHALPDSSNSQALQIGAYAVNLRFDNFQGGLAGPLTFDVANRMEGMSEAGGIFGTTPHPGTLEDGDGMQYVAAGPGVIDLAGADLMQVDFTVPHGFLAGQAFDVSIVPVGEEESQITYVGGYSLTLDQLTITAGGGPPCDLNGDQLCDVTDIDLLSQQVRDNSTDLRFDLDQNGQVEDADRHFWVHELMATYVGDADLNGVFDTTDLVQVFQAGQFEDAILGNSNWSTGDWNGDTEFDSSDFVLAFQDGGFEEGPRSAVAAVPEPSTLPLLLLGLLLLRRPKNNL